MIAAILITAILVLLTILLWQRVTGKGPGTL
jgi:hypothetical protein